MAFTPKTLTLVGNNNNMGMPCVAVYKTRDAEAVMDNDNYFPNEVPFIGGCFVHAECGDTVGTFYVDVVGTTTKTVKTVKIGSVAKPS